MKAVLISTSVVASLTAIILASASTDPGNESLPLLAVPNAPVRAEDTLAPGAYLTSPFAAVVVIPKPVDDTIIHSPPADQQCSMRYVPPPVRLTPK